jgi:hypothetical protein
MSKPITAVIPISQPFTVTIPGPMTRAEPRTHVVLGEKHFGMFHTSHPAPPRQAVANNSLREHPTYRAAKDPRMMPLQRQNAGIFSMPYGVIDCVGAHKA